MSNSLINESSPYLRAHSENPVDWLPWTDAAFEKAKKEDKPVFLSIGYSTCHWCHVMAEESFENRELAAILNESFISVKVDREERPDVDSVYMKACTAVNGSGGWPLTAILTPEGAPFFLATYMPAENRNGRMGLKALLRAIAMKWENERSDLIHASGEIVKLLKRDDFKAGKAEGSLPEKAAEQLMASFDDENGGFGRNLKFPSPQNLIFLTERAKLTGDKGLRQAVELTLRQMYRGGIYDHFGGGFCRYSTDAMWHTPHFEKTLYDNALMAFVYTQAWQEGHLALYRKVAEDTLDYALRELKGPEGGFFAGQDADSKGREGEYYLFTEAEVCNVLGGEAGKHFCECYDITKEGNFEGRSIPNLLLNSRYNLLPEGYGEYTEKLRLYREERMALFTDEKILAGRNGLMLMALSRAARAFSDRRYLMEAEELEGFILKKLVKDGRLHAVRMGERLYNKASLSDIAFCALGMLELYEADFDAGHIENAMKLAGEILKRFADEKGGFFDTPDDGEKLIVRPKEMYDGALPSGNSAVAVLLYKLFRLTGNAGLGDAADRQLDYISRSLGDYPAGCAYAMTALSLREAGTREMVCAAPGENMPQELKAILGRWAPELTVMFKSPANAKKLTELAPFTAHMEPQGDKAAYYICSDGVCALPIVY